MSIIIKNIHSIRDTGRTGIFCECFGVCPSSGWHIYKMMTIIMLFLSMVSQAQDVEATVKSIGIKKGIKASGGVRFNNSFYIADGISNRMQPYTYVASGNLNIKAFGFSFPITFTYSNQNFTYKYSQPFNIVGLSPYYKSITLHAGYRNLSYSGYTLNGHSFLGGGIDWKPKFGLRLSAMAGRFLKAVEYDSTNTSVLPSYERWGMAAKVGYQKGGDEISLIWFGARDQPNTIKQPPLVTGITAQENMVWSIAFKKALFKTVSISFETARSAWTKDVTSQVSQKDSKGFNVIFFNTHRLSTAYYGAYKASISKEFKFMKVGLNYERVEPEYKTLGAYYFNSDLENINGSISTTLFKKKVNVSASLGLQRDDLNDTKLSKMKRTVGSLNIAYKVNKRLNLNGSYSNFNSFINVQPIDRRFVQQTEFERVDTLNYVQITQTINGTASFKITENSNLTRTISANSSYNLSSNKQGNNKLGNNMFAAGTNYNQLWKKYQLSLTAGTNYNQTSFATGESKYIGMSVGGAIPLLKKKLRASLNINFNNSYENNHLKARLITVSNLYNLKVGKRHGFNAGLRYSGRAKLAEATLTRYNTTFNEFFIDAGYAFNF